MGTKMPIHKLSELDEGMETTGMVPDGTGPYGRGLGPGGGRADGSGMRDSVPRGPVDKNKSEQADEIVSDSYRPDDSHLWSRGKKKTDR